MKKQPSLFSAIAIATGPIIGSGWLFAAYYASKSAGPISILSWIVGAGIALAIALLLAEIVTMYQQRGLFSRLLSISHNRDYGFVVAISGWLGLIICIPSEAEGTVQYLSTAYPKLTPYLFLNHQLTSIGVMAVIVILIIYGFINYWGIKTLTKVNNIITVIKLLIPTMTGVLIIAASFHSANFTAYKNSFAPYGVGKAFSSIVSCGIFYSFYGFGMITLFANEIKNPQRNIPIALISSIGITLTLYLILQVAFIGALPTSMVAKGWHQLNFTSPLAQLSVLLGLNVWTMILYADSALSPSGTGIIYSGSGARTFTGMAQERQMPKFFDSVHPLYQLSRRSLIFSLIICIALVVFFRSWQSLMIIVSIFQLLSCIAIPISFTKLREDQPDKARRFKMPMGKLLSPIVFFLITYLLTQSTVDGLVLCLGAHLVFFAIYAFCFYRHDMQKFANAFLSSWTMFLYMAFTILFGYISDKNELYHPLTLVIFIVLSFAMYHLMLRQRDYSNSSGEAATT